VAVDESCFGARGVRGDVAGVRGIKPVFRVCSNATARCSQPLCPPGSTHTANGDAKHFTWSTVQAFASERHHTYGVDSLWRRQPSTDNIQWRLSIGAICICGKPGFDLMIDMTRGEK